MIKSKYQHEDAGLAAIKIGDSVIRATTFSKNIGAVMDEKLDKVHMPMQFAEPLIFIFITLDR